RRPPQGGSNRPVSAPPFSARLGVSGQISYTGRRPGPPHRRGAERTRGDRRAVVGAAGRVQSQAVAVRTGAPSPGDGPIGHFLSRAPDQRRAQWVSSSPPGVPFL